MAGLRVAVVAVAGLLAACEQSPRQLSDSGYGAFEVSLAAWDDGLAAVWYDTRDGNAEIYARFLDASGRDVGVEWRVTTTAEQSYEADIVAVDESTLAIAWYEKTPGGSVHAQLGAWRRDGGSLWRRTLGASGARTRNPIVCVFGDALFAAWIESGEDGAEWVHGGWFERDGQPRGEAVRLGRAGATTWNLNGAVSDAGIAAVVFDALVDTQAEELFLATLVESRASLARITADDGAASKYPDIALLGETAALTWFDERDGNREVYLGVMPLDEMPAGLERHARRITETPGQSIGAYLAWNGERLGLSWSDDSSGNYDAFFQSFDRLGRPTVAPLRLSKSSTHSLIPAIRPWRDGFALAWDEVIFGRGGEHDTDTRGEVVFTFVP